MGSSGPEAVHQRALTGRHPSSYGAGAGGARLAPGSRPTPRPLPVRAAFPSLPRSRCTPSLTLPFLHLASTPGRTPPRSSQGRFTACGTCSVPSKCLGMWPRPAVRWQNRRALRFPFCVGRPPRHGRECGAPCGSPCRLHTPRRPVPSYVCGGSVSRRAQRTERSGWHLTLGQQQIRPGSPGHPLLLSATRPGLAQGNSVPWLGSAPKPDLGVGPPAIASEAATRETKAKGPGGLPEFAGQAAYCFLQVTRVRGLMGPRELRRQGPVCWCCLRGAEPPSPAAPSR